MLYPIKNILVNWVDGMKISKEHLVQLENYFIDAIRDMKSANLTNYNYGILPPYKKEKQSSDFEIMEHVTDHIEVELRCCNAITAGGCRININAEDPSDYLRLEYPINNELENSLDKTKDLRWNIILVVCPFERIPTGAPDPEETPPRHPNARESYTLSIKPVGQINVSELGMHHLIIGQIVKQGDRYEVDQKYIPPCTSMLSHPELKRHYESFGKYLNDIEIASRRIIQKIQDKEKKIDVAQNTDMLCKHLMNYIASIYFKYKNTGQFYTPLEITDIFSSFAHTCYICLHYISKKKREEMLQYFYEWSDMSPGNFTEMLSNMIEISYDHHNIRMVMEQIELFLSEFSQLWIKLSELEYVGQHKENIVVAEKVRKVERGPSKATWTILDE